MRTMNKTIWPFQTNKVDADLSNAVYRWCEEKLGHGGHYELNWYYNANTSTWCFKDERKYLMFCLRWSN